MSRAANTTTITDIALCNHNDRIGITSGSHRLFWRHVRIPPIILGLGWDRDTFVTDNFGEWGHAKPDNFSLQGFLPRFFRTFAFSLF